MDIYCVHCGEPWELDCLHEETEERVSAIARTPNAPRPDYAQVFDIVRQEFYAHGCYALRSAYTGAADSCERSEGSESIRLAAGALYELLGDDIDGAAAMLEDFIAGY